MCGTDAATYHRERPGMSAFVLDDDVVYHTYSTFSALSSSSRAFNHCSRVPVLCVVIVLFSSRCFLALTWCLVVMRYI